MKPSQPTQAASRLAANPTAGPIKLWLTPRQPTISPARLACGAVAVPIRSPPLTTTSAARRQRQSQLPIHPWLAASPSLIPCRSTAQIPDSAVLLVRWAVGHLCCPCASLLNCWLLIAESESESESLVCDSL
jgi:hypothetical protein